MADEDHRTSEERREQYRREFEENYEQNAMINSLIRIAKDLERSLIGVYATAGLLALIAGLMVYRLLTGR